MLTAETLFFNLEQKFRRRAARLAPAQGRSQRLSCTQTTLIVDGPAPCGRAHVRRRREESGMEIPSMLTLWRLKPLDK